MQLAFSEPQARGVKAAFVPDRASPARVLGVLHAGVLVSRRASTTLFDIGLVEALEGRHTGSRHCNRGGIQSRNPQRARRRARIMTEPEVFLGGAQAASETGEVVCADAGGSRQGGYRFGPSRSYASPVSTSWCRAWREACGACAMSPYRARTRG